MPTHMDRIYPSLAMAFNPEAWNTAPILQLTNCQGYALNTPKLFGHPGGIPHGGLIPGFTADHLFSKASALIQFAHQDGLIPVPERHFNPAQEHIVALLGAEADLPIFEDGRGLPLGYRVIQTFHYYRLDEDGTYSGKMGKKTISRAGEQGNLTHHFTQELAMMGLKDIKVQHAGFFRVPVEGMAFKR